MLSLFRHACRQQLSLWGMLAFFACTANVRADQFDEASDFYNRGKYQQAGEIWRQLGESDADTGRSHYQLAELYRQGLGFAKDLGQALVWYRSAAEKNYLPAMYELGVLLYRGDDLSIRDVIAAKQWWEQAANLGHVFSQREMAQYHLTKDKDLLQALIYARAAAAANDEAAFSLLKEIDARIAALSIAGPDELRVIPQHHYTLALASFIDFNSAWSFIVANGLVGAYMHQSIDGEYDVTLGNYRNLDDSYAAIAKLSAELRALHPRPQSLKVIQHVLFAPVNNLDPQWVKDQAAGAYTIEIYRGNSHIDADDLVNEAGLRNSAVYRSVFADSVVVAGVFSSSEEAAQVINTLPDDIRALRPIARQFANVQAELVENKRVEPALVRSPSVASRAIDSEVIATDAASKSSSGTAAMHTDKTAPREDDHGVAKVSKPSVAHSSVLSSDRDAITPSPALDSQALFEAGDQWLFNAAGGAYTFQIATLQSSDGLQAAVRELAAKYNDLDAHVFDQQDPEYYYIYLGLFDSWRAVNDAQSTLNLHDAVIRSVDDTRERRCRSWSKQPHNASRYNEHCL